MRRRTVLAMIGGSAVALPRIAIGQQTGVRHVAILTGSEGDPKQRTHQGAFRDALQSLGWIEGQNITLEYRYPGGDPDRSRAFAIELTALSPDVIVVGSSAQLRAVLLTTSTIPVVFTSVSDPVRQGFVSSTAKPGGNVTGFSLFEFSMAGKWVELLAQLIPDMTRIGPIFNPSTVPQQWPEGVEKASRSLHVEPVSCAISSETQIEPVIARLAEKPHSAAIILPDNFNSANRARILASLLKYRIPSISPFDYYVSGGALASYGIDQTDLVRRSAFYVDRILRGESPGDLPVQAPTKFELVINLKTAKTLGLTIPPSLLARADEVIE